VSILSSSKTDIIEDVLIDHILTLSNIFNLFWYFFVFFKYFFMQNYFDLILQSILLTRIWRIYW